MKTVRPLVIISAGLLAAAACGGRGVVLVTSPPPASSDPDIVAIDGGGGDSPRAPVPTPDAASDLLPSSMDQSRDVAAPPDARPDGAGVTDTRTAAPPTSVIFFYTPLGTVLDAWRPTGSESNFQLGPILKPLEPLQSDIVVVDGIDNLGPGGEPTTVPDSGAAALLTGRSVAAGTGPASAGGPSIDNWLGRKYSLAQFPAIQLGVFSASGAPVIWSAAGQPTPLETSPRKACDRIFSGFVGPIRCSDYDALPTDPLSVADAQAEVLFMAVASGLTRVGTLVWLGTQSTTPLDANGPGYRSLADASASGTTRDQYIAAQNAFATRFAALVSGLRGVPQGTGSLLDSTLLVWLSESGEASGHSGRSIPVVLAGRGGGKLRTGRYLRYAGRSQVDLLQAIAQAVAGDAAFGDPALVKGPLAGLFSP